MRFLLFFLIHISCNCLTIGELFIDKNTSARFYIDEWLAELEINNCNSSINAPQIVNQKQWNLIKLTQSLPIRVLKDKGLFSLMQPGFRRKTEPLLFRADLIATTTKELVNKLISMNNWFLRSKIEFKFLGKNDELTIIHFSSAKEFYLNQFHSDFREFSTTLFGTSQYCLKTSINDWLTLQRDLIFENHTNLIPNPYGKSNQNFSKFFRIAPGSNLQP